MIRDEYLRFLQTLKGNAKLDDVRKIANLVLKHLDVLIPLSTSQGQRIKKVVELAQANWATINTDIQTTSYQVATQEYPFMQLKNLSVGPFRGFSKQENFDLASKLVLIYGPNGTGKTSFCEALEFGLLDNVAEAENKRFRPRDYLKNAHTESFTQPVLIGLDRNGKSITIFPNEVLYRFCFVEKIRIDNFSRIAAQSPSKQKELISTLFGLDEFTEFVHNFTDNMDYRYIDLEGVKAQELDKKREKLSGYQQQLETMIPEEIQSIEMDEKDLAKTYREGCTFLEMVTEIQGTEEKTGLIKHLKDELEKQLPQKNNITTANLEALKHAIGIDIREFESKQDELAKSSQQVSFKQLYEALTKVQNSNSKQCPACQTPLDRVKVNPFDHASTELKKLEPLCRLQESVKLRENKIKTSLNKLSELINICCSHTPDNNPLLEIQITGEKTATIDWWRSLIRNLGNGSTLFKQLEIQVKQIEDTDKEIDQAAIERTKRKNELDQLYEIDKKLLKLKTRREMVEKTKKKAQGFIDTFVAENAQLIADVEAEKAIITQNTTIANAYELFVQKLNIYKNNLPAQLVDDLCEKVVELYNAFNRNDAELDKLAKIRLPLNQNQHLEISFKREPEKYFNALYILSESHIRCIGLAILTAKNLKEKCPLLIFDDPVNAIDDEHRDSVRRTLFEDSFFSTKQIILACHGEEFFKDIQNLLSVEQAHQSKTVSFLPKNGNVHICVDMNCKPRNYIIAARTHFDRGEIRDALGKSRQALESLTKGKVWQYVNRYGDGNLSIKMRSATAPIELRNLTEQLKSKIENAKFTNENKDSVLTPIVALLGINGDSREWRYLNKGTHEEENKAEFDYQTVNEIINALEKIDYALMQAKP
jgi:DNA sulfur modification protein DndD